MLGVIFGNPLRFKYRAGTKMVAHFKWIISDTLMLHIYILLLTRETDSINGSIQFLFMYKYFVIINSINFSQNAEKWKLLF